jgi:hypothetical protein
MAIAAAIGFHSFTALFLPLPWLVRWQPPQWPLVIMAAGGAVCVADPC